MANRLVMNITQGIVQLFAAGMSERQIARTLNIDGKLVDRELHAQVAKGANLLNSGFCPEQAPVSISF